MTAPTFAEAAEAVRKGLGDLSACTRDDRKKILADGPLVARFGAFKLDAIRRRDLKAWWDDFLEGEAGAA